MNCEYSYINQFSPQSSQGKDDPATFNSWPGEHDLPTFHFPFLPVSAMQRLHIYTTIHIDLSIKTLEVDMKGRKA